MPCIYGLADPSTLEIRYVGQTVSPLRRRISSHISASKRGRSHKDCWIRSLDARPLGMILEDAPSNLNEAERRWILQFRADGARLTNVEAGGNSAPSWSKGLAHTAAHNDHIRQSLLGHDVSLDSRLKMSQAKQRITEPQARAVLANLDGKSQTAWAGELGISRESVRDIMKRKTWKWL